MHMKKALASLALIALSAASARAAIIISEVDPSGSGSSTYKQDWFELTNTGTTDQDITGWKMDDNSQSFSLAVPIRGITSIPAGASVVFIENGTDATKDAALFQTFETAWFGSNVPAGFIIAAYGGAGVGLSQTADGVNIFDSAGNQVTGVQFGATALGITLDNAAGLGISAPAGTTPTPTDPAISTASVAGTNGAFVSPTGETGSPGTTVPEPASIGLLMGAAGLALSRNRSRRTTRAADRS
jgi:hypothetical protein